MHSFILAHLSSYCSAKWAKGPRFHSLSPRHCFLSSGVIAGAASISDDASFQISWQYALVINIICASRVNIRLRVHVGYGWSLHISLINCYRYATMLHFDGHMVSLHSLLRSAHAVIWAFKNDDLLKWAWFHGYMPTEEFSLLVSWWRSLFSSPTQPLLPPIYYTHI